MQTGKHKAGVRLPLGPVTFFPTLKNGDDIVPDFNETAGFVDYDGLFSLQLYCLLSKRLAGDRYGH